MKKVQILSSKIIKPSIPTPLHLRKHHFSFIDQLSSPIHFGIIFFFLPENENKIPKKCDQLEKSLSEILTLFYPLAGRFSRSGFSVDCNDHGVEVSRARVLDGHLMEILSERPETYLLDTFVPSLSPLATSDPCPILAVQINIFSCGGIAVGIRIFHNIGDGFSVITFMSEWANWNREGTRYRPSFELGSLFPARELVGLKPVLDLAVKEYKLVTKCFLFDASTIPAWKAEAATPLPGKHLERLQPSRVQVVTAHLWRTKIRIARAKHGRSRPSLLYFAISLRGGRIPNFQIPKNSFGTLVGHTTAHFPAKDSEIELHELVSLLSSAVRTAGKDSAKARNGDDIYGMLIEHANEIGADKPSDVDLCRFTSWCGFSCYGIDFGWGKPCWVATVSKFVELVFLLDTECGNAIEAWVTLDEEDMVEFECQYRDHCKTSASEIFSKL